MPGDILLCSLPHLIALPCQTRAERAKAPSPVPRSISWQSFESNCDCSALRSSASERTSRQAIVVPAYRNCLVLLLWQSTLPRACALPRPGLASFSLFTDLVSRLLSCSHTHTRSLSPSGPPLARLQSPVSSFQSPVSPPPWVQNAVPILPAFDLQPTWTACSLLDYILAQPAADVKAELLTDRPSSPAQQPPALSHPLRSTILSRHGSLSSSE